MILKEKVAGYNNVPTLATKEMMFDVNENVNYVKPIETSPITPKTTTTVPKIPNTSATINNKGEKTLQRKD